MTNPEIVPDALFGRRSLVEEIGCGKPLERPPGTSVSWRLAHAPLLPLRQRQDFRLHWTESQLSVKPERSRADGFRVLQADLVGIDGEAVHAQHLAEQPQDARKQPCRFTFPERVIQ